MMNKIGIIILAAGSSSRMGVPKQLLPYKDTTILGWVIKQALRTNVNAVFCVLGNYQDIIKKSIKHFNIPYIYNSKYKEGVSTSIVKGVEYAIKMNLDSVIIVLADQPYISWKYLNKMVVLSIEQPLKIIASTYKDNLGVPALFPKKYFNSLLELTGDKGAQLLLQKYVCKVVAMPPTNLLDVDTIAVYNKLISTKN